MFGDGAMNPVALRRWLWVHRWTSWICTLFLLIACVTGLPLIFHHDLDHLSGHAAELPVVDPLPPRPTIDRSMAAAIGAHPGNIVQLMVIDPDEPDLLSVRVAPDMASKPGESFVQPVDMRTATAMHVHPREEGIVWMMFRLHSDLYAGLVGSFLLGFMGLMFVVAVVTGIVVYRPFMRKLDFGTVRRRKAPRVKWLDVHNLFGITTLAWALTVGATGVVNTMALPMLGLWQSGQLAEMTAPYRDLPPPGPDRVSVSAAIDTARRAAPGSEPFIIAMPGSAFSSRHHYAVFMRGGSPLTARLLKPALIDAQTGQLTAIREMPWYIRALFLSQPLHFGDYGGRALQVAWALLDIVTIVVLLSGLRLTFRGKRPAREAVEAIHVR